METQNVVQVEWRVVGKGEIPQQLEQRHLPVSLPPRPYGFHTPQTGNNYKRCQVLVRV